MDNRDLLRDVRFLRDLAGRTQASAGNTRWPVTLAWGSLISAGYATCGLLATTGRGRLVPWGMPVLIVVGWLLHYYLLRRSRLQAETHGVSPRFRSDLLLCWAGIVLMGLLWTGGLVISGAIRHDGYLLIFAWCSLLFVGYVMNGVWLAKEWFWAAAILLASLVGCFLAGPDYYWFPGYSIGATAVVAGLLGRREARRQAMPA